MHIHSILRIAALLLFAATQASAQQTPTESTSVNRTVLPIAPEPFQGVVGLRSKESKPAFPRPVTAPSGAPNV
ncbi:MAG: hypothetical protein ACK57U_01220, partial [Planctomycetota bacterium]